jgi:transcriptional/translational regulatory protein YebC/TACO1
MFDRVGEIEVAELDENNELALIDAGATDFEDKYVFTDVANLTKLTKMMSEKGLEIIESKIIMKPKNPIVLKDEDELTEIMEMIDELEENDDVVAVFAGFDYHE